MTDSPDRRSRQRAWSYRRQRLGRAAEGPLGALRDVVAVYSSHPTAPLALLARAGLDSTRFGALEERREALRIPAMRQSIFLVPRETAGRIFAATRLPIEKHAPRLRFAGLDWDQYAALKRRVLEVARAPMTTAALQAALGLDQRAVIGVKTMCREGLVLRIGSGLRSDSLRYVATEAWLGEPLEEADDEQALRWLAEAYLRGYGPARVADFAWWSGVPKRRAQAALADLAVVDVGGGLLLPADQQPEFERVEPISADALDLLPKWDAYTMGHAPDGRERLLDDAHLRLAYTAPGGSATSGDGLALVLWGGRGVATWSHRFEGDRLRVSVAPFEPDTRLPGIERAFEEIARLLGATALEVVVGEAASGARPADGLEQDA